MQSGTKNFKFEELTKEQFDAHILLSALKSPADEHLSAQILQKLNQNGDQVRFDELLPTAWTSSPQRLTVEFSRMKTLV